MSSEISAVIPLDLCTSYAFKASPPDCSDCAWKKVWHDKSDHRWEVDTAELGDSRPDQCKPHFRPAFGPIVRLKVRKEALPALLMPESKWVQFIETLHVVCFTRGIGVIILRGTSDNCSSAKNLHKRFEEGRESLKNDLLRLLQSVQIFYKAIMDSDKSGAVYPLDIPGRRDAIDKTRFPYPIVFTTEEGWGEEPLCYRELTNTFINVGWATSTVCTTADNLKVAQPVIEDTFVVGMASWFSLVVMNSAVSAFLQDSFIDMSQKRPKRSLLTEKNHGRLIRLAFMEATNASRPVRWTFNASDMLLLDKIHEKWMTKRWWRNVEERTAVLAAHHSEVAAEKRTEAESNLAKVLLALAILTAVTGLHDLESALKEPDWPVLVFGALGLFYSIIVIVRMFSRAADSP